MQSVQRHFGRYMKRTADENQVSVLLKDFEDADQLLTRIIEASKAWRESWLSILTYQHRLFAELELLYQPIVGATDDYQGHQPVLTAASTIARTERIKTDCEELKTHLTQELNSVDSRMIRPAQDARDSLHVMRKTVNKRENKKLDYERYQSRVDSGLKKTKRSERENTALQRAQSDLVTATEAYNAADDHLRGYLPQILTSVFSLLPHLLAAQIQIQNDLLAHYYTVLHTYCTEEGFPSPSPPMDEVIRLWDDAFKSVQQEAESIAIVATGKAVRMPMNLEQNGHAANGYRRPSGHSLNSRTHSVSPARALPPSPNYEAKAKISSSPSAVSLLTPSESIVTSPSPSAYATPLSFAPAGPNVDYFSRDRQSTTTSAATPLRSPSSNSALSSLSVGLAAAAIQKKRPPPPPPPRLPSQTVIFVTALYDFGGQGEGDLIFKEGDRIKVLKKTDSTDDWWQGELRGVKGAFPANYCQ